MSETQFAFVRLEKIAEDVYREYGRVVLLEDVVSACQELGIPTSPIDLGDGRAALLCETEHEENLKDYFHSKLAIEDAKKEAAVPLDTSLGDRLEAVELRTTETSLMQKRMNSVLAGIEKRLGKVQLPGTAAAIEDLKRRVSDIEKHLGTACPEKE